MHLQVDRRSMRWQRMHWWLRVWLQKSLLSCARARQKRCVTVNSSLAQTVANVGCHPSVTGCPGQHSHHCGPNKPAGRPFVAPFESPCSMGPTMPNAGSIGCKRTPIEPILPWASVHIVSHSAVSIVSAHVCCHLADPLSSMSSEVVCKHVCIVRCQQSRSTFATCLGSSITGGCSPGAQCCSQYSQ
jgi:hypothetical protein